MSSNYSFFSDYVRFGGCKRLSCKLMGSSSGMSCMVFFEFTRTVRFAWVVGKSAPNMFLPMGDPNNIVTNIRWIFQQQYSYQLVMLILGCNNPKISCIPRHLHPKTISTNPRWIPIDETTRDWGQQNLSLWQAFKNTACHVLFTKHGKAPVVHLQASENPIEKLSDTGTCEHAVALQTCMMERLPVRILIMIIHHLAIACCNQIV